MRTKWYQTGSLVLLFLGIALPAQAGWIQTERDGAKTLISEGKIKEMPEEPGEGWVVMNYRDQKVLMVNPGENTCTEASFDDYCQAMQDIVAVMKKSMAAFAGEEEGHRPPEVKVKKVGAGGKLAGFETTKYQVFADGELYEEVWLTTEKALMGEVGDQSTLLGLAKCMGEMESEVESNPAYVKMITSGWTLKSVSYDMGQGEIDTEVVKLEKKDLPRSEFTLPAGCRRVPLQEVMSGGM